MKVHMWKGTAKEGYLVCGRDLTKKTPLTTDKSLVTCVQCLGSLNRKGQP